MDYSRHLYRSFGLEVGLPGVLSTPLGWIHAMQLSSLSVNADFNLPLGPNDQELSFAIGRWRLCIRFRHMFRLFCAKHKRLYRFSDKNRYDYLAKGYLAELLEIEIIMQVLFLT